MESPSSYGRAEIIDVKLNMRIDSEVMSFMAVGKCRVVVKDWRVESCWEVVREDWCLWKVVEVVVDVGCREDGKGREWQRKGWLL